MNNQIRTLVQAWRVNPYTQLRAADHRNWTYDRLAAQIGELAEHTVQSGPYRGMKYFGREGVPIVDPVPTTKLIGSFEEEIHPWIESLIGMEFRTVVHIGSGEGYHVVGMAQRLPRSRVVVFDTLIAARKACRQLADQNRVRDRIQLRGFCGGDGLLDVPLADSLIFWDCGGAELNLLDPELYPAFTRATMLVETHDAFDNRISPRLMASFKDTHKIEFVSARPRDQQKYPILDPFDADSAKRILDEKRQFTKDGKAQRWALMTPYTS
jgi:hypothetical protein